MSKMIVSHDVPKFLTNNLNRCYAKQDRTFTSGKRNVSKLNSLGSDHWPRRKGLVTILVPTSNTSNNHSGWQARSVAEQVGPERKLLYLGD